MKTIQDNPNSTTENLFDRGLRLPLEATTVIDEINTEIVQPASKVYSEAENQAIRKSQTY